jgi:hypothetical protein
MLFPGVTSNLVVEKNKNNVESEYWGVFVYINVVTDDPYSDYLYESLVSASNWNSSHMLYLHQENATKQNIMNSLDWLRLNSDRNDFVVFAFASHGNIDFIAPFNATSKEDYISSDELKEKLDAIEYKGMCVILDTCQSGIYGDEIEGKNRVVLKSTFRKGDGWIGTGDGKWYSFTKFIGDAVINKIDYNNDNICSAEESLKYAQQEYISIVKMELHPILWIPRLIIDIIIGVPLRYLSITIPYPTLNDDYDEEFPLVYI